MADIYLGVAIVLCVALLAGLGTYRLAKRGWRWTAVVLTIACAAGLALNVAYLRHSLWPARVLPFSNVMVLGDPNPWLAAVLVGAGAALMPGRAARRSVLLVPLAGLCLWGSYGGVFFGFSPPGEGGGGRGFRQTFPGAGGPGAAGAPPGGKRRGAHAGGKGQTVLSKIYGPNSRRGF